MTEARWRLLLEELYGLAPRGIQPGLERVREALARLDHPERAFDVAHVAGTNGKGSVAAMIAHGLTGRRVGLYTSPHLHSLTERFQIDGTPVPRALVIETWASIRDRLADVPLSFFEAVTVLGFELFRREGVELAVLETGLGGRLDATNVIERPLVTAITKIALDHQSWLGDDLAAIAAEKAGILRPAVPCVVGRQVPEVDEALDRCAAAVGAPLLRPRHDGPSEALHVRDEPYVSPLLSLGLAGEHQKDNAAVAVGALRMLEDRGVAVDPVRAVRAHWPGRLERRAGRPDTLFDVAHNPDGAAALRRALDADPGVGPLVLVFGVMRDKNWSAMLATLRPAVRHVVLTAAALARSEDPDRMAEPGDHVERDVTAAVRAARELAGSDGLVIVTGSAFVVAEARAFALGLESDPPIAM